VRSCAASSTNGRRARLAFVAAFFALSLVKVARHEIWADEAEYWAEARDSNSLRELYYNSLYVGQPLTTFFPYYVVSRFTRDPFAMQIVNAVEITAAVAVVVYAAPWGTALSALFAIGYFPFFEYGTISRHYALPMLCGFAFCALYQRAGRLGPGAAAAAACLALASFHGTILAIALLLTLGLSWLLERRPPASHELLGCAAVVASLAFAIATAVPPTDSMTRKPWLRSIDVPATLAGAARSLCTAFAPLPPTAPPWWNKGPIDPWPSLQVVLGIALLGLAFWSIRRSRLACLWLGVAATGLLAFAALQWGGWARHAGLLFLAYLMAVWLAGAGNRLLPLFLALQVPGGLFMSYKDLVGPFSPSVATADYLRRNGLDRLPMLGHKEFIVNCVFTLLDRRFYSAQRGAWVSHPEFSRRMRGMTTQDVLAAARALQRRKKQDLVLVMNGPALPTRPRLRFEACFTEQFVGQSFCVYRMTYRP
jgi:hypothetical protein